MSAAAARPVIRLFGPLAVEDGERVLGPMDLGGARPKQVLQILLAARGHQVTVERLAELLWPGGTPRDAAGSVQTFVSVLRSRLTGDRRRGRALVVTERGAYRFATELAAMDLDRFDELLDGSAREPTRRARAMLEEALALVRGEVLEDEPYAGWATDLRGTYAGRVLGARLDAADAALAERDFPAALLHADAAAAANRFSERARRATMLALYAMGRPNEALAGYRAFRSLLAEELGLEPAPPSRALEAAVIRQEDPAVLLPRPVNGARARRDPPRGRLIGRGREIQGLEGAVRRALEGDAALVSLEGDAGLGKTTMLDELARRLPDVRLGRAAASDLERHLPYVPLATALREALGDVPIAPGRSAALGRILPERLVGGGASQFTDVEVLEALVAVVAEAAPLVLVLDDVHLADDATIAALAYLRRRGVGLPLALVTSGPPPDAASEHPSRLLRPDVVIRLDVLSAEDLDALGLQDLGESTGGHPRLIADVLEGAGSDGSRTLRDALLAQCRAEGPHRQRLLVAASVLGQPFAADALAGLLGAGEDEVVEELERLCERRILRVDGLGFRFRYDLVRQVLAESISPARRRLLGRRLAGATAPRRGD